MNYIIVIPARYKSSRFPGKPLADICGKTMIQRVWEICISAIGEKNVFVATDDKKIENHCLNLGIQVLITSESCLTGTDRLYEASRQIDADVYVNVQGDEPLIKPEDIKTVIDTSLKYPNDIVNAMCNINNEEEFRSVTIPKVVCRPDGRLLYMSRAPIPTGKAHEFISAKKQVCVYAYPKKALNEFGKNGAKGKLESIEDIEILRFLELGHEVKMVEVSDSSIAVDTPSDLERVQGIFKAFS